MTVTMETLAEYLGKEKISLLEKEGHWPPSAFDLQVLTIPFADEAQHPNGTLASILQAYVNVARESQART